MPSGSPTEGDGVSSSCPRPQDHHSFLVNTPDFPCSRDTSLVLIIGLLICHISKVALADPPGWGIPPKLMSLSP